MGAEEDAGKSRGVGEHPNQYGTFQGVANYPPPSQHPPPPPAVGFPQPVPPPGAAEPSAPPPPPPYGYQTVPGAFSSIDYLEIRLLFGKTSDLKQRGWDHYVEIISKAASSSLELIWTWSPLFYSIGWSISSFLIDSVILFRSTSSWRKEVVAFSVLPTLVSQIHSYCWILQGMLLPKEHPWDNGACLAAVWAAAGACKFSFIFHLHS